MFSSPGGNGARGKSKGTCVVWRRGRDSNLSRFAGVRARRRNPEQSEGPAFLDSEFWRRGRDSNPRYPSRYGRFRGGSFQPLTHLSASAGRIVDNFARSFDSSAPATSLRISAAGSDARKTPQLSRRLVSTTHAPLRISGPNCRQPLLGPSTRPLPRTRSGFRLRAQTPAKRLNFRGGSFQPLTHLSARGCAGRSCQPCQFNKGDRTSHKAGWAREPTAFGAASSTIFVPAILAGFLPRKCRRCNRKVVHPERSLIPFEKPFGSLTDGVYSAYILGNVYLDNSILTAPFYWQLNGWHTFQS